MSDLAWVIFSIALYLVIIKPMMQGILQIPKSRPPQNSNKQNKATTNKSASHDKNSEYVDYEEVE